MGWIHWLAYQKISDVEVVAIATPEEDRRSGDWTSIQGNFGPPGEMVDLTDIRTYETIESMLADDVSEARAKIIAGVVHLFNKWPDPNQ